MDQTQQVGAPHSPNDNTLPIASFSTTPDVNNGRESDVVERQGTPISRKSKERKRVGFVENLELSDTTGPSRVALGRSSSFPVHGASASTGPFVTPDSGESFSSTNSVAECGNTIPNDNPFPQRSLSPDPPNSLRRASTDDERLRDERGEENKDGETYFHTRDEATWDLEDGHKAYFAREAQVSAQRLAKSVQDYSGPHAFLSKAAATRKVRKEPEESQTEHTGTRSRSPALQDPASRENDCNDIDTYALPRQTRRYTTSEAHDLVRRHTQSGATFEPRQPLLRSGQVTPVREYGDDYVPRPSQYRNGILSSLLKLYEASGDRNPGKDDAIPGIYQQGYGGASESETPTPRETPQRSPLHSGAATPERLPSNRWQYHNGPKSSTSSLSQLLGSSSMLASPVQTGLGEAVTERLKQQRRQSRKQSKSSRAVHTALGRLSRPKLEDEIKITVHIAETIARQKYLLKLCKALMQFGAPTHRLEEYLKMSARVLEVDGQFLYIPGCMIVSFDDASTHTTDMQLVRVSQGVDLGKLRDTHEVYKAVVHDKIGVEEATQNLKEIMDRKSKIHPWLLVLIHGLASVTVGPFAFKARPIDLPMAFLLGTIVGILQLMIASRSDEYSRVFEISAAVITSFLARAFGSIRGGDIFCFSALAQSSIALILPGYTVLCSSLELQSRSLVAGSVRMVYAIIYSLFLGFGITIGTALYGVIDKNATSETTCKNHMPEYYNFVFVPAFTLCLIVINRAKVKQVPVMMILSVGGYAVTFFSSRHFRGNAQISSTLGALTIGVMANLYSRLGQRVEDMAVGMWRRAHARLWGRVDGDEKDANHLSAQDQRQEFSRRTGYGVAAAAMLPAIFVQVPSGLSVSGSLVSGITSANQIVNNVNGTTVLDSGDEATGAVNSIAFTVGLSVIQIAIGITVGLFLSALIVYPYGKRRSGLFSF